MKIPLEEKVKRPCTKCKGNIPPNERYFSTKGGPHPWCRPCRRAAKIKWELCNPQKSRESKRKWEKNNRERKNEYTYRHQRKIRKDVIDKYGGCCSCCGESMYAFLSIDHINRDGAAHKRAICKSKHPNSVTLIKWIRRNNYPNTLRVLCYNCNLGRERNEGICPHEQELKRFLPQEQTQNHGIPSQIN